MLTHENSPILIKPEWCLQDLHSQHLDAIHANAVKLLAKAIARGGIEIQHEFSYPLAVTAIASVLGMPPPDIAWFKRVTKRIADVLDLGYVPNAMLMILQH